MPPSGPPICTALISCPSTRPPPSSWQISAIGVPKRTSYMPGRWKRSLRHTSLVPGVAPGLSAAYASLPRSAMKGMLQSVSTLWTTVGLPCQPRSAGNGGRADTVPRKPWSDASSAVSSPTTYEPAPSSTYTSNAKSLPWMPSPRWPSARARSIASLRTGSERGYSERTKTKPTCAPTA